MSLLNLLRLSHKAARRTSGAGLQPSAGAGPANGLSGDEPHLLQTDDAWLARSIGGISVRVAREPLNSEAAITAVLQSCRLLSDEISLAAHLLAHICPVELPAGSREIALLVSERMVASEELAEVLRSLARKGYVLTDGSQVRVYVSQAEALVLSVSRGDMAGCYTVRSELSPRPSGEGNLWRNFVEIVAWAVRHAASDIHINIHAASPRSQIRFTIDSKYVAPDRYCLPTPMLSQMAAVAYQQGKGGNGANFQPLTEQQCRITLALDDKQKIMLRWASMATDDGPQITLRILRLDGHGPMQGFQGLGYLPSQVTMLERAMLSEGGAIVVGGVLGSGKSTLLATLMASIPSTRKIMTLEDPREYVIPGAHQNTIARSLDEEDDAVYLPKLRNSKRSAFTDLMISEIRDRQTGLAFQDIVESGPNIYTTVHARRHIGIPDRLASPFIGVDRAVLATPGILKLLVGQTLLPLNCVCAIAAVDLLAGRRCAQAIGAHDDWHRYFTRIERLFEISAASLRLRNPAGCEHCLRPGLPELAGYRGRTVVAEMVEPDETFLRHVRDSRNIELEHHVDSQPRTRIDDPDASGKSALEVALYKMLRGWIDPREIEPRFSSFETIELRRNRTSARLRAVS
ncbi:MAG: ATPase, T2SS/T4P/T4SS family [Burkholderiaceae bacterium]|nr:ATPase, T2SS/T4P/T4SS family [Burkholderiaceae bacterium]